MAFLKQRRGSSSKDIHWSRADRDGIPFRGSQIPLLKDEEFESLAERVVDCYHATFDTSQPEQRKPDKGHPTPRTYQEILDGISANWFTLLHDRQYKWIEKEGAPVMFVYIEWSEPYLECSPNVSAGYETKISALEQEVRHDQPSR